MKAGDDVTPRFKQPVKRKASTTTADRARSAAVGKRDGSRCQFPSCGLYDKSIPTHHKASRKQRPDLRHEVSNGVRLCLEHHLYVHANPDKATEIGFINRERHENR